MERKEWLDDEEMLREPIRGLRVVLAEERSPEIRRQQLVAEFVRLAEQLGLPLGTVKGRLRLGLEKLRSLWLDETGKKQ